MAERPRDQPADPLRALEAPSLALRWAGRLLDTARAEQERASRAVEAALHALAKAGAGGPASAAPPVSDRRRQHRPGTASRLDADAELQAVVRARIERTTFQQIVDAVAADFPPERCVSRSGLHRWWHDRRRAAQGEG